MALTPMSGGPAFAPKMPLRQQWLGRGQTGGINPRLDMEQMGAQDAEPLTYQGEPVDPRRMLSKPMPGGAPMSSLLEAYKQATGGNPSIGLPMMPPVSSGGMQSKPMPGMGVGMSVPPGEGMQFGGGPAEHASMQKELLAAQAAQTGKQPPVSSPPAGSDPPVMEPGAQFTGSKQPPQIMPGQQVKPPVETDFIPPQVATAIAKGDPGTSIKEAMGATDDLKFDASKPMPTRYPSQMGVGVNDALRMDPSKPMPMRYPPQVATAIAKGDPGTSIKEAMGATDDLKFDASKPMPTRYPPQMGVGVNDALRMDPSKPMPTRYPPQMGDQGMNGMGPDHIGGGRMGRGRGNWLGGGGMGQPWPAIMGGDVPPAYLGGLRGMLGGNAGGPIMTTGVWNPKDGPGGMRATPMPEMIGPVAQPAQVPMGKRRWTAAPGTSTRSTARVVGRR